MSDVFEMPVHPIADLLPMQSDEELNDMAASIEANGLLHPLLVKDGVLIDGRNRREACRRLGITPKVTELNGQDPVAVILTTITEQRSTTKGQRAMLTAMAYPDSDGKGGRGKRNPLLNNGFNQSYLRQAREVLRVLPETARIVLTGEVTLPAAYDQAQAEVKRANSTEYRWKTLEAKHPELAALVRDGDLTLEAAEFEVNERAARHKQLLWTLVKCYSDLVSGLDSIQKENPVSKLLLEHLPTAELWREIKEKHPLNYPEHDLMKITGGMEVLPKLVAVLQSLQKGEAS